jgi:hypothetical protein
MSEARTPNPLVDQFRRGGVPPDLRLMAAQGALPLKPADLVELLVLLSGDREENVAATAVATLEARPAAELLPLFKDRGTPAEVLAWGLRRRLESELREAVLQNTTTSDDVIEELAPNLPQSLAELVVINQVRLLRRTSLLEALESNPDLSNDQQRRLRELRETFKVGAATAPPPEAAPPAPPAEAPAPEPEPVEPEVILTEEEVVTHLLTEDERKQTDKVSAARRLLTLNTAGKVIAALKGSREERALLIRDPNRIVSTAVLGSPRLTDSEVESFAAMKNISDEVLRHIGRHREWTRHYGVISNLVKNPRTPVGIALGLVPRLNPRDIKALVVDRNVPEAVRKQAQRFVKGPGAQR